jgi:hypothetical protein
MKTINKLLLLTLTLSSLATLNAAQTITKPIEHTKAEKLHVREDSKDDSSNSKRHKTESCIPSIDNINKALASIQVNGKTLEMSSRCGYHGSHSRIVELFFAQQRNNIGYFTYRFEHKIFFAGKKTPGYIVYFDYLSIEYDHRINGLGTLLVLATLYDALNFDISTIDNTALATYGNAPIEGPFLGAHAIIIHPASERIFSNLGFSRTYNNESHRYVGSDYICDMITTQPNKLLQENGPRIFAKTIAKINPISTLDQRKHPVIQLKYYKEEALASLKASLHNRQYILALVADYMV